MHPNQLFSNELVARVRSQSAEMESTKEITPDLLQLVAAERWFQALEPKSIGGLELPLPEAVSIFEGLAWIDGNLGWVVNLGAGANMFSGYLGQDVAEQIYASPSVVCAGSGAKGGTATRTKGGWILNARWKYCSGSNHAAYFDGNALLEDEDHNPIMDGETQAFKAFIFPAAQGINHRNWNSIGLKATSSNDLEAKDLFVPESHVFTLLKPSPHAQGAIYKFPFDAMAIVNMTVMYSGLALHFEDLYNELAAKKRPLQGTLPKLAENSKAKAHVEAVVEPFHTARRAFYAALGETWKQYELGQEAPATQLQALKGCCKALSKSSRDLINGLFPLFGMNILNPDSEANRVWRDAATCSQHYLMSPL